ncbi:hypothetical protein, partial [Leptospira borgpetersenii]|uniref:hypothetical protein n=1 Tax=Leptospira borgpetersenii TaxID=174 RepID=UPI001D14D7DB
MAIDQTDIRGLEGYTSGAVLSLKTKVKFEIQICFNTEPTSIPPLSYIFSNEFNYWMNITLTLGYKIH